MKHSNLKNINKIIDLAKKQNAIVERIEHDKKACEGNIWHELTLNDIETLEYQLNQQKNEVKKLENQLKEQSQLIKQIQGLAKNYIEPKPAKNKHIYAVDLVSDSQYIFKILPSINNLLFNHSSPEQWRYIFDGEFPITEIEVKSGVTLKDIRYFFDKLREKEVIKTQYITNLTKCKGILFKGNPITETQLNDAYQKNKRLSPKHAEKINSIFDIV